MLAVIVDLLHLLSSSFNIQKTTSAKVQIMSHQITFLIIFSPSVWKLLNFTASFQEKKERMWLMCSMQ